MDVLVREKVEQAHRLMEEHALDSWVVFAHETGRECDHTYPLLMGDIDLGGGILLLTRTGRRVAIVSGLDQALPRATGAWDEIAVVSRERSGLDILCDLLQESNPASIGVNFSEANPLADGLTHGKYLALHRALGKRNLADRLVSAEGVAGALRQVKTPGELARIRAAVKVADEVFARLQEYIKPGMSGTRLFEFVQNTRSALGASNGWSGYNDPILTIGPREFMGHTPPPEGVTFERGMLMQVDLGVRKDGYCSDFQRMFYALAPGETHPPAPVERLFRGVYDGISRMIAQIKPGVPNDAIAKHGFSAITELGFPEPAYGAGHQLGRAVHDGGCGLTSPHAPMPGQFIREGNVFTVEGLETRLAPCGWVSLEENVVVTKDGCELLTNRQKEIYCI